MRANRRENPEIKSKLHSRNNHRERYNFELLIESCPELTNFVLVNKFGDETIDFFNPQAVKILNKALLIQYYNIQNWDIPQGYLCPPIPGRADYIHYIADLLASCNNGKIPEGSTIKCLDIGVGANCIYPLIGSKEYGWSFVGSDIDAKALKNAKQIVESNPEIKGNIELRIQKEPKLVFKGIIQKVEKFDVSISNPPFHSSAEEARKGTVRKTSNLKGKKTSKANLNFGGQSNELWTTGGELGFIRNMIAESQNFSNSCKWFTSLVSKEANLEKIYRTLKKAGAKKVKTIPMGQGNKKSRIIAWTFQ